MRPLLRPEARPLNAADVSSKKGRRVTSKQLGDAARAILPAGASRRGSKRENKGRSVRELSVHEVELSVKNRELQRVQLELEASRDRFALLYDLAPVGYLTLDTAGRIHEANLTAARLLGMARQKLLERYLTQFVTADVATEFTLLLARAFGGISRQEQRMAIRRADGVMFHARLVIIVEPADDARPTQCLVALDDVTSLHHAERHAREHLAQLRGITEVVQDGIITVDTHFRIMFFNRAAETMFGRRADEMMGRPINSIIRNGLALMQPKRHGSSTVAGDATPLVNGPFFSVGKRADGGEFQLEASVSEVEVDGNIFRTAILRDISRRMLAEAESRRLAAIVENSLDAILTRNRANIITTWNAAAESIFGYTAAEIVGKPYAMLAPRLSHASTRQSAFEGERNPLRERIDATRVTKNGGILTVSVKQAPLRNAEGEITGISEILHDVTRERIAEKTTRESEAALTDFFDNAPVGLVWVAPGGVVVRTNEANLAMLGRTKASVVGQPAARWFADPECLRELESALGLHDTVKNFRSELKTADDSRVHVLIDAIRSDPVKGRLYTYWFIRDITARVESEKRFLKAIDEERMLLGAELHDDLAQQLTGIQYLCEAEAMAQTLKDGEHSMRTKKITQLLHRAITHVGLLAGGLSPLGVQGLGLDEALSGLAESIRLLYKCECEVRCDHRLHFDDQTTLIHVYRLIQEALKNAVRHGQASRIKVALLRNSGGVKVTVEDDGRGVDGARAERGGVSLKILKYRAQACGASVSLEPRESGGAILNCLIPVQRNLRPRPKQ